MKILLLNSTTEARHFLDFRDSKFKDCVPWSIHPCAADYLNNRDCACRDISEFVSESQYLDIIRESGDCCHELLMKIDNAWSAGICENISIPPTKLFLKAYIYNARLSYIAAKKFALAVDSVINADNPSAIEAFDNGLVSGLAGTDLLGDLLREAKDKYHVDTTLHAPLRDDSAAPSAPPPGVVNPVVLAAKKIAKKILRPSHAFTSAPTIVLFEPFYDMAFIERMRSIGGCRIVIWPDTGVPATLQIPIDPSDAAAAAGDVINTKNCDFSANSGDPHFVRYIGEGVKKDFLSLAGELLPPLVAFHHYASSSEIRAGVWGNTSHRCSKKMIISYLMDRGIPVFGMRHGGCTEIMDLGNLIYSIELEHCSRYFSFGATESEIGVFNNPKYSVKKEIIVSGSTVSFKMTSSSPDRPVVDILVSTSNCANIFKGCSSMGANRFYERQRALLKELDKETELKIVCKPQRTDDAHCTVPDTLKSLKHIKVVSGISLKQFVADHATRSIVMDVPSSPLCEMINLDIDIFLIRDALSPFIPQAEELLAKRVFLYDNAAELVKGIEKWKRGELPRLRDDSFAKRYVYRDNAKGTITGAIAAAVKQK